MADLPRSSSDWRTRRDLLVAPLAAATAGALTSAGWCRAAADSSAQGETIDEYDPTNVKLAHAISDRATDDDMLFLQQLGLRWVRVNFGPAGEDLDAIRRLQKRLSAHEIQIYSGVYAAYSSPKIQLGMAGRDQDIERYQKFLRNLGQLGVPVAPYDFHPGNTYATTQIRNRGYLTRQFDLAVFRKNVEKQVFDRDVTADEIWQNYEYFMKAVLPVAEEADVRLAQHPDDPPVKRMNGIDRVFTHYNGYRRADEITGGSSHWGLTFCIGTWLEGGDQMGKNVLEMIEDFGSRGKIFGVHFRNVSSPLPKFHETFPDDGYADMYEIMKALRKVRFKGSAIPDHIPRLAGDERRRAGVAYCIACMRSHLLRANLEVG